MSYLLLALVLGIVGCDPGGRVKSYDHIYSAAPSTLLLGPESFPFCGGWVEIWSQVEPSEGARLFLKVSPAKGSSWRIWNAHLVIESPKNPGHALRFKDIKDFKSGENTNVASWSLDLEGNSPAEGLKVALRPFDGCTAQQMKGVVLKKNAQDITP